MVLKIYWKISFSARYSIYCHYYSKVYCRISASVPVDFSHYQVYTGVTYIDYQYQVLRLKTPTTVP
jgi:hypothetical protein